MNKARAALMAAVLLIVCAFSGCHGSKAIDPFAIPEEFDFSRDYEITFWAKNDTNMVQVGVYQKAVADFEKLYPNIKVNIRFYTDYKTIYNDVITNISTNTTPNVCITYPDHIATYITGINTVVPLDDLFTNEKYGFGGSELRYDGPTYEEVTPKFLAECVIEGSTYAIPYVRSTEACYVNKTYVEKLGYTLPEVLTWDFIWEVSDAAARKDSDGNYLVNGQKVMIPFIYKSTDNMMIQMLKQKGSAFTGADTDDLFGETTEELLFNIADHVEKGAFSTFKISSYPANFLNAGQCIFAIDSTAGATWMGSKAPLSDISADKIVDFETTVLPIPQFDPENPEMISQGPSICIFNKSDPQEVLASWIFAQYLLTNDVQIGYSCTDGYIPVTSKAFESPEYTDYLRRIGEDQSDHYDIKILASELLLKYIDNTFVTPVFNGSASLRDAAGQLIEDVTKSVRRKQTVDADYMDNMFADVVSLYRLESTVQSTVSSQKSDLGPLPAGSCFLLIILGTVWVGIITFAVLRIKKNKKY